LTCIGHVGKFSFLLRFALTCIGHACKARSNSIFRLMPFLFFFHGIRRQAEYIELETEEN
jgi:hypothetical protein